MNVQFERWTALSFFMGCSTSKSSVAVVNSTNRVKTRIPPISPTENAERAESSSSFRLFCFRKPDIGCGIQRLIRSIRHVSRIFAYRNEEEEIEMEIGYPTDVKHLTHIGLNGSITTIDNTNDEDDNSRGLSDNTKAPEIALLPSVSLKQLEMAMAAQVEGHESQDKRHCCPTNTVQVDD